MTPRHVKWCPECRRQATLSTAFCEGCGHRFTSVFAEGGPVPAGGMATPPFPGTPPCPGARRRSSVPPALVVLVCLPIALLGSVAAVAFFGARGGGYVPEPPPPTMSDQVITRGQALSVYPGEPVADVTAALGPPDSTDADMAAEARRLFPSIPAAPDGPPNGRGGIFYDTDRGDLLAIALYEGHVSVVNLIDKDSRSVEMATDAADPAP